MSKNLDLWDLPWMDVVIPHILTKLSILDILNLRCVCKPLMEIIDSYLHYYLKDLTVAPRTLSHHAFIILGEKCKSLVSINLRKCSLTNEAAISLFKNNKDLVHVNLQDTKKITAKCLQPLIIYGKDLHTLKVGKCKWLTSGVLESLGFHQRNLTCLDLTDCTLVSENAIIKAVFPLKGLLVLNLSGNTQVTDRLVCSISKHNKMLQFLNLQLCHKVTDKGIRSLEKLDHLEGLVINFCDEVTEDSLMFLRLRVKIDRLQFNLMESRTRGRRQETQNYEISPLFTDESDVDLSDTVPTFVNTKPKKKKNYLFTKSCSSSTSSSESVAAKTPPPKIGRKRIKNL